MRKITLGLILFTGLTYSNVNLSKVRETLKIVETGGDPTSIGDGGESFGILQIQNNVILDVNRKYGTHYTHQDAFDIECAEEIFQLYINMWVGHLEKKEGRKATIEDIVRIWNGGPRGYKRRSTDNYYKKFRRIHYTGALPEHLKLL